MKKTAILILCAMTISSAGNAQGLLGNLFNQKKLQSQRLKEQIAALQAYIGFIKKANDIARDGTELISSIKDADLLQHTLHFDSLRQVRPSVKSYAKIKSIYDTRSSISRDKDKAWKQITQSNQFTSKELTSLQQVYKAMDKEAGDLVTELEMVTTDGKLQMTDAERIGRIDKIYDTIRQVYSRQRKLDAQIFAVAIQRQRAATDAEVLRRLYGNQ